VAASLGARPIFVAGAHTDVGKTHVACALIRAWRAQGVSVDAFKPVVSGFDPDDWGDSDPGRLLTALGRPHTPEALAAISPWRYRAPLAPPMAARREGEALELAPIVEACRDRIVACEAAALVVEGVGGLMSPIAERATGLDLMLALGAPTVLVGGSYLGAISHLLTAAEVLASRGAPIAAVVVSESAIGDGPGLAETVDSVAELLASAPIFAASRGGDMGWAEAAVRRIAIT